MISEEAVKIIEKEINNIYGSDGSTLQVNEIAIVTLLGRPNGGWIPISEEKPDKNKPVLISGIHRKSGQRGVDIARYSGMVWQYDGFTFPDIKIEAWMPLPEPFEGGEIE